MKVKWNCLKDQREQLGRQGRESRSRGECVQHTVCTSMEIDKQKREFAMGETEAGCCFTLGFCSFILLPGPGNFVFLGLSHL